jgi:hypothetical protein
MGLYDAQKNPFHLRINSWSNARTNDHLQRQTKGIPCHVTKIDKDFVEVQFDTHDNTLTPPTVKLPQSFSTYSREPTQVGDKGYAVPSDYHLGASDGWGGGSNYYPRANLAPLSFQPVAHTDNPKRDYDQHTIVGGPKGVLIVQSNPPKQDQQQQQNGQQQPGQAGGGGGIGTAPNLMRVRLTRAIPGVGFYVMVPTPQDSSSTGSSAAPSGAAGAPASTTLPAVPEPKTTLDTSTKASLMIDENQKHTYDGTGGNKMTIEKQAMKLTVETLVDGQHWIYVGGDGKEPMKYAQLLTTAGPVLNARGRIRP